MRSNKSQMIEKAETRKSKVEQLPYDESLSQLSELTLTGETKTTYNSLKQNALDSKNQYLLPVEEKIHQAEGLLDKFKFSQAQTEIDEAHELMDKYEENYNELNSNIENILNLHKESDHLYEECKVDYREMKRDVLANRHQFGEAAAPLEQEIETFVPEMETYETLKEDGNYNQAYDHIKTLNEDMNYLKKDMDEIPE
ncbi:septation ring formation regulator EzrA, partial [Mesorhizobium sp. M8A.F.Ca.ET.173.01.1.1]